MSDPKGMHKELADLRARLAGAQHDYANMRELACRDLQRAEQAEARLAEKESGCPCSFREVEPCRPQCTCRNPHMSGGCGRCCRYGSHEQRVAAARYLVGVMDDARRRP